MMKHFEMLWMVCYRDIMEPYLPMVKQGLGKHSQWKVLFDNFTIIVTLNIEANTLVNRLHCLV